MAEVRFGLRAAFSTASLPVMPLAVDTPRPASAHARARPAPGPTMMAATTSSAAPRNTGRLDADVPSPIQPCAEQVARRAARAARPIPMRTFDAPDRSMATSRSAASGGTRVARTAGMIAATSVTTTPISSAWTVVVDA